MNKFTILDLRFLIGLLHTTSCILTTANCTKNYLLPTEKYEFRHFRLPTANSSVNSLIYLLMRTSATPENS